VKNTMGIMVLNESARAPAQNEKNWRGEKGMGVSEIGGLLGYPHGEMASTGGAVEGEETPGLKIPHTGKKGAGGSQKERSLTIPKRMKTRSHRTLPALPTRPSE